MTEFTVGETGAQAMPGSLPEGTLYTFAMDLSFDEVGPLQTVEFSQDVFVYLDNFIALPVATEVPNGHYDYRTGLWVPDVNGIVMQVVGVSAGLALIDADLTPGPDSDEHLATLGLSDEERESIAGRYAIGESFWRMPMRHFTPADYNLGGVMKERPDVPPKPTPGPAAPDCENTTEGSIVYCHRRALGEEVPISGTGLSLHYQSDRTRGNTLDDRTLEIDFTGMTPPQFATALLVHVEVMGRVISDVRLPVTAERHVVVWDGLDAYGRYWNQPVVADYAVEWITPLRYNVAQGIIERRSEFGAGATGCDPGTSPCCMGGPRLQAGPLSAGTAEARVGQLIFDGARALIYRSEYQQTIGGYSADRLGLGGFGLDDYHVYSVADGRLLLGSGDDILPREVHSTVFAGGRSDGVLGRSAGGLASRADVHIGQYSQVALGPDGTVYFVQVSASNAEEIWSVTPGGELVPVLVNATLTPEAWASWSALWSPFTSKNLTVSHLATDRRGRIYFVDVNPDNQLFRLARSGDSWSTEHLAGASQGNLGTYTLWEDGGSAKRRMSIRGMTISSNGTPHVQVFSQSDGAIHLLEITSGDRVRRREIPFQIAGIAAGQDGAVVVANADGTSGYPQFTEVRMDGSFRVIAGGGSRSLASYASYPATELRIPGDTIFAVGKDGVLYFMVPNGPTRGVYRVDGTGMASRYNIEDLDPPSFASPFWDRLTGISAGPGGTVLIAQQFAHRVVLYSDDLSGTQGIASRDGREVYMFDGAGMHLRTVDAVTGVDLLTFEHDADRRLTAVVDRDGQRTEFERVGSTAILAHSPAGPGGARVTTTISLNAQGYAEEVADPVGARWSFRYEEATPDAEGLLREMWAPRSNTPAVRGGPSYTFDYERFVRFPGDQQGPWVLTRDTDPLGRVVNLEIPETTSAGQPGHRVVVAPAYGTWCDGSLYQTGWTVPQVTTTVVRQNGAASTQLAASTGDGFAEAVTVVHPNGRTESRQEPGEDGNGSRLWPGGAFTYHVLPDPLVGTNAPYVDSGALDIASVAGRAALRTTVAATRAVTLDPLDLTFPFTVLSSSETSSVNVDRTTTTHYNAATRTYTSTSPEGRVSQRITDALGRTVQVRSPGQLPTHLEYDAQGYLMAVHRGTGAGERRVDYTYDARGYMNGLSTRVDPTRTVSVVYSDIDGRGQPRDTTVPGIGATMSMEPDVAGAPVSVSPPGQPAHGFDYSIIGQATEYRPPGVAEVPDPADCPAGATCTVYDIERRIDQVVQADGQVLDLTYNQATGQLTSVSVPDDGTYTFSYDPTTGNLNTVTGPPGTVSVQTLWQSDLPIASISTGPVPGRVDVTYNNFLETSELAVTGGHGVRYTYDRDGLVTRAADASSPTGPALQLTRAALDGHVEQDVLGVVQTELRCGRERSDARLR
jgi:YD repeat-containing protein